MNWCWVYHAKRNKLDGKGQKPYDFTHMWVKNRKLQVKNQSKQGTMWWLLEGKRGVGENQEGKGG